MWTSDLSKENISIQHVIRCFAKFHLILIGIYRLQIRSTRTRSNKDKQSKCSLFSKKKKKKSFKNKCCVRSTLYTNKTWLREKIWKRLRIRRQELDAIDQNEAVYETWRLRMT